LSGLHCLSRVIALPRLSKTLLAEAIRREAERVVPVPLEQLYISWQIIPSSEEETQVFMVALPSSHADALIRTLHRAGVKPYLMDLAPLALARVVDKATAIIVDVQSTEVNIVFMVEGIPQLTRSLSLPDEAQPLQRKLTTVGKELERAIEFYNASHLEKPVEPSVPIFVSGELAQAPKASQSLAGKTKYSVLPLSSPLDYPEGFPPSQYMANIGLALKELSPGGRTSLSVVNLNALPEVYQPKRPPLTKILAVPVTIVAIGLLVPLVMLVQGAATDTALQQAQLNATNQLLQQKFTQQQSQKKEITELEQKVSESEATYSSFAAVLNNLSRWRAMVNGDLTLSASTSTLPSDIDLSGINHAMVTLTISGTSPSETEVLAYAGELRASGRFSQVIVSSIQKAEDGMDFELTLIPKEQD
jgi:type IV pilus assembly protein PilM